MVILKMILCKNDKKSSFFNFIDVQTIYIYISTLFLAYPKLRCMYLLSSETEGRKEKKLHRNPEEETINISENCEC